MMWCGFIGCRKKSCVRMTVSVCIKCVPAFLRVKSTRAKEQGIEVLKPNKLALASEAIQP